ncbi:MAG TPA: adenylate/guanylate cyclase domain-containing protein [Mycobacteriales bacterium]|nr:adenylate/guanylate cyclase domain-containing protein [Mycobacteriales bacterium]
MPSIPEIRYARSGDVHIAYQTWGSGPALVGIPPFAQNIEALWGDPTGAYQHFLGRIGEFATVTHFDKRGTGLSDRGSGFHGIEERIDDIRAVMDAIGLERASIGGISEGGPMALLFAATYPERVDKLMLFGTGARFTSTEGYPHGMDPETFDALVGQAIELWATPDSLLTPMWMPSLVDDAGFRSWVTGYERASASPGAVRDAFAYIRDIDVRGALPSIQAPALVLHRTDELIVDIAHGRYLADNLADARFVELPGIDHVPWVGDADSALDRMEEFLTGTNQPRVDIDRVLATVVFTDIVDSTRRATEVGDSRWRSMLDRHDATMREQIEKYGGIAVKSTGDGFLATFDSPSRAVRAARSMVAASAQAGLPIRSGLHTGEIERRGDDVAGIAVHIAARVAALAGSGETIVSSTVRDLMLGSEFSFADRGSHALKGVEGDWRVLAVEAG